MSPKKEKIVDQNGGFFQIAYFYSGKTAFLKISADFMTELQKLFFYLNSLQTRMQIDVNDFVISPVVPEIYAENTYYKNR